MLETEDILFQAQKYLEEINTHKYDNIYFYHET